jgi:hypothetical protein
VKKLKLLLGIFVTIAIACDNKETLKPLAAELIHPKTGELGQPLNAKLEWENPNTENRHYQYEVYMGKTKDNLENADYDNSLFWYKENPKHECYALDKSTKYYWKIRIITENHYADSEIWEFTTTDKLPKIGFQNSTIMIYPSDNRYLSTDEQYQYLRLELSGATNWTDGYSNTLALVNDYDKFHKEGMYIAAKFCYDLIAYGYNDWYLPSAVELDSVNKHLKLTRKERDRYWSSNEYVKDANFGHIIEYLKPPLNFESPYGIFNKYGHLKCRCIRRE